MFAESNKSFNLTPDANTEFLNEEEYLDGLRLIDEDNLKKVILEKGVGFDLIRAKNLFEIKENL